MSVTRRIAAMLDLAVADLDAAGMLAAGGNRYAAYHLQQAVEKMVKATLLSLNLEAGIEHRLDLLLSRLPDGNPWRQRLAPFVTYTPYATTYRYPTPGGRIPEAPPAIELTRDLALLRPIVQDMRRELVRS